MSVRASLFVFCTTVLSISTAVVAQNSCSSLVAQALNELDQSCSDVSRNTACYGYDAVTAQFTAPVAEDYFAIPSDQAGIAGITTLQTAAMDIAKDQWGVALLNVQASMPEALPGQGAIFILLGDSQIENAVPADEAFQPASPIDVLVRVGANVRSGPGLAYNTVGTVGAGNTIAADGRDASGEWLRVTFRDRAAWISTLVLQDDPAFLELPTLDASARTTMQAFYLQTGIGEPSCAEAPQDGLIVQGPQNVKLDLTVNGANVRIGSTVAFTLSDPDTMQISVLDGEAVVMGGGADGGDVVVPTGYKTTACLTEAAAENPLQRTVNCPFSQPERDTEQNTDYCGLQVVESAMLYYPVDLRCPGDAPTAPTVPTSGGSCADFRVLSPDGTATPFGEGYYSWTKVNDADEYVINFQEPDGRFLIADYVGNVTSATYRNASLNRNEFRWVVLALKNQQILCSTPASQTVTRLANPEEAPPVSSQPTAPRVWSIYAVCLSATQYKVIWQNRDLIDPTGFYYSGPNVSGSPATAINGSITSTYVTSFPDSFSWTAIGYGTFGNLLLNCP